MRPLLQTSSRRSSRRPGPGPQAGLTLIELLVAVTIGLIMSLAIFGVITGSERSKRNNTGVNDLVQSGSLALFQIDEWIRSAGSGFSSFSDTVPGRDTVYGCKLTAALSSTQTLPFTGTLPAPFASVNPGTAGAFRLAPVLILPDQTTPGESGQTSDVLVVMAGTDGMGGSPQLFSGSATATTLSLPNTVPYQANDLVLVAAQKSGTAAVADCMLTQAASTFSGGASTTLNLGGSYYAATINSVSLTGYANNGLAMALGNPAAGNPPQFLMIGVGDHSTLYTYDLLKSTGTNLAVQVRDQGVFELHALYGVDTNGDNIIDTWVKPSTLTGNFTVASLMAGTLTSAGFLKQIRAIRVGLIQRTPLQEKDTIAPASLSLFGDLGTDLKYTRTLSADERKYRYRTIESTVPLRNQL